MRTRGLSTKAFIEGVRTGAIKYYDIIVDNDCVVGYVYDDESREEEATAVCEFGGGLEETVIDLFEHLGIKAERA